MTREITTSPPWTNMTLIPKHHTAYDPDISMGIMVELLAPDIWIFPRWLMRYSII